MQFGSWQTEAEVEPRRLVRAVHDETRQAGLLKLLPAPAAKRESILAAFGAQQELGGGEKSGWLQIYEYGNYGENQCYVVYQEATHRLDSDITQGFTPSAQNVRDFGLAILAALIRLRDKSQRPHGNLKPTNVFFAGDYGNVLLTDPAPLDSSGGGSYRSDMQALGILIYQVVRSKSAAPRFMQSLPDDQPLWPSTTAEKRDARWRSFVEDLMSGKYDEQPIEAVAREFRRLSGSSGRPVAVAAVCVALVGVAAAGYFFVPVVKQYFKDRQAQAAAKEDAAKKDAEQQDAARKAEAERVAKENQEQQQKTAAQQKANHDNALAQVEKDYENGNDDAVVSVGSNYPGDPGFSEWVTKAQARIKLRSAKDNAIHMYTSGAYANYDFIDQWRAFTNQPDFDDVWRAALAERDLWVELSQKASGNAKYVVDYLNDAAHRNLLVKQPFKDLLQKAHDTVAEEDSNRRALDLQQQQEEAEKRRQVEALRIKKVTDQDYQAATDSLNKGDYGTAQNLAGKYPNDSRFQDIAATAANETKKLAEAQGRLRSPLDDNFASYLDELSAYRSKKDWQQFFSDAKTAWDQFKAKRDSNADFKKAQDFFEHGLFADAIGVCESRSSEPTFVNLLRDVEAETNAFYSANQEFGNVMGSEDLNKLKSRDTYSKYITNGKPVWANLLRRVQLVEPAVQKMATNSDAAIAYLTTDVDAENRAKPPFTNLLARATSDVDYRSATNSFQKGDYTDALTSCYPRHAGDVLFDDLAKKIKTEQGALDDANAKLKEGAESFPKYVDELPEHYRKDGKAPWKTFYDNAGPVYKRINNEVATKKQVSGIDDRVAGIEKKLKATKGRIGPDNVKNLLKLVADCQEQYQKWGAWNAERTKRLDQLRSLIQHHDDDYPLAPV
jgi:hypothetical protein